MSSQIKEGSRFINEKLKDKGYFQTNDRLAKLLFNSIDLQTLKESDDTEDDVTNTMRENDKHVINVIYDLLENIEKSKESKESTVTHHQQLLNEIKALQKQNEFLNNKIQQQDSKMYEKDLEILRLNKINKALNHEKTLIKKERNLLKVINESLKDKQKMDIKRKNLEIDELRDKLIIKLNSIQYTPRPLILPPQQDSLTPSRVVIEDIIDKQTQTLLENSSNLIYELILQNEINSNFLIKLNSYFINFTNKLQNNGELINEFLLQDFKKNLIELKNFDKININKDLNLAINEITNFNDLKEKLIESLENFDISISKIISQNDSNENDKLINNLNLEIEKIKKNWLKLNENANKWKNLYIEQNKLIT